LAHLDDARPAPGASRAPADVGDEPVIDLQSGYVQRADALPAAPGSTGRRGGMYQNYVRDLAMMRRGKLDDGVVRFA
jgi:monooxygenase